MNKNYQIILVCSGFNGSAGGRAVVHEIDLPALLQEGEYEIGIYGCRSFSPEEIYGRRIEDMPFFTDAQKKAEAKARQRPFQVRPICVIDIAPKV